MIRKASLKVEVFVIRKPSHKVEEKLIEKGGNTCALSQHLRKTRRLGPIVVCFFFGGGEAEARSKGFGENDFACWDRTSSVVGPGHWGQYK